MDPDIWDEPEMHRALAVRDIITVYQLLHAAGVSQRQISDLTGQNQSEVNEICRGRRQVLAYDVLKRIADGLGIPHGHMGLAQCNGQVSTYSEDDEGVDSEVDDDMVSRRVLGSASLALLGEAVLGEPGGLPVLTGSSESLGTLGKHDAAWIKAITDRLWALDLEYGGASIFGAARGVAVQVVGALRNSPPDPELLLAASKLCCVTAWTAFDADQKRTFWKYHATALDLAREAKDLGTIIRLVGVAGRAEILSGNHQAAAKLFELVSFRKKPDAVEWGLLGSAYAPNYPDSAKHALVRLRDAEGADTLDAMAMLGHVNNELGDYASAIAAFNKVVPHRSGRLALQETAPLAVAYLQSGECSIGCTTPKLL